MLCSKGPILIKFSRSWLNTFSKRLKHDLPKKKQPFYRRWFEYTVVYTMGSESSFHEIPVADVRRFDKLGEDDWDLIYHDFDASRISFISVMACAIFGIASATMIADYFINGKFTTTPAIKLQRDAQEFGIWIVFPATLFVLVGTALLRLHQIRVLRIYQNYFDPDSFVMVRGGFFKFFKQIPFKKSEVKPGSTLYDLNANYFMEIGKGNVSIGSKAAHLNLAAFREPTLKSYMLGERNVLPGRVENPLSESVPSKVTAQKPKKPPVSPPVF